MPFGMYIVHTRERERGGIEEGVGREKRVGERERGTEKERE